MTDDPPRDAGLRERKRRDTRQRIAETGLRLFLEKGYEQTTLDLVAEAAGISRRTFFYYFDSKEDILLAWQNGIGDAIRRAILAGPGDDAPLDTVLAAILSLAGNYDPEKLILIDRLLRSTEQLRASKHAKYLRQEQAVFEALCQKWPQDDRRDALRLVAMICIGILRIAVDRWVEDGGTGRLADYLRLTLRAGRARSSPPVIRCCRRRGAAKTRTHPLPGGRQGLASEQPPCSTGRKAVSAGLVATSLK